MSKYYNTLLKPAFINERAAVLSSRHPDRDAVIDQDDMINLRIALETSNNIHDFLEAV